MFYYTTWTQPDISVGKYLFQAKHTQKQLL